MAMCAAEPWRCVRNSVSSSQVCRPHGHPSSWWPPASCALAAAWRSLCRRPSGMPPYAGPLLEYLVAHFRKVLVVAVRRKLFPRLSEDCWLLFADGFGGAADEIGFTAVDALRCQDAPPRPCIRIDVAEWRDAWRRRLRPYLLAPKARALYLAAAEAADNGRPAEVSAGVGTHTEVAPTRLGAMADVGLGYVSGANGFFHLTPSTAHCAGIPERLLQTTVRSARVLPPRELIRAHVDRWKRDDEPMLLLHLPKEAAVPAPVRHYLDCAAGRKARETYKCRHRTPWYSVPDVRVPTFFLTYMAGRAPNLVRKRRRRLVLERAARGLAEAVHHVRQATRRLACAVDPTQL